MSANDVDVTQASEILRGLRLVDTDLFLRTFLPVDSADIAQVASTLPQNCLSSLSSNAGDVDAVYEHVVDNANSVLGAYEGTNFVVHSHWKTFGPRNDHSGAACVLGNLQPLFRTRRLIAELETAEHEGQQDKIILLCQTSLDVAALLLPARVRSPDEATLSDDIQSLKSRIRIDSAASTNAITYLVRTGEILTRLLLGHVQPTPSDAHTSYWVKHIKVLIKILSLRRTSELEGSENTPSWLRINTPMAMRQTNLCVQHNKGSLELCRRMQEVLAAQPDRHFVFGILVRRNGVRVFYCDRSGVLATDSWIDVRTKDRDKFIQVVLALSGLSPRLLGWDLHMKLYRNPSPGVHEFRYTTDTKLQLEDYGPPPSHAQWAIFVPDDDTSAEGVWYFTVQQTNVQWDSSVIGPASISWMVRKLNSDMTDVMEGPPLALKLTWARCTSLTEKELHGPTHINNVGVVLSSVKSGFVDSDGVWTEHNTENLCHDIQTTEVSRHWSEKAPGPVEARVLVKTLSQTIGWPVRFFTDLTELVKTIRDALQGHRNLYFKNGVLHRNITPDSILIRPTAFNSDHSSQDPSDTTAGCLIDLDHATQSDTRIEFSVADLQISQSTKMAMKEDDRTFEEVELICRRCKGDGRRAAVLSEEMKKLNLRLSYPTAEQYERWIIEPETRPPSWQNSQNTLEERTGTPAFMSHEIIKNMVHLIPHYNDGYLHCLRTDIYRSRPIHNAIHDIESFFWVLVYQCLVLLGPGRPALFTGHDWQNTPVSPAEAELRAYARDLFENESGDKKCRLFVTPRLFETQIVDNFHPYFERVKPLVREWWHLLQCTYRAYNDVAQACIHEEVLALLTMHLEIIVNGEGEMRPTEAEMNVEVGVLRERELERRKRDLEKLRNAPWIWETEGGEEEGKGKGKASGTK